MLAVESSFQTQINNSFFKFNQGDRAKHNF